MDDIEPDEPVRRRLPIVKSLLALLLIVIIGAGYAAWRYTQSQYYVGEDTGHVAIFRGINQNLAGLKLSSVYQKTRIPLAAVPLADQQLIRSSYSAGSLDHAQSIVGRIRGDYQACTNAYAALGAWQAKMQAYTSKLNAYMKKYHTTAPVKSKTGKVITTPPPRPAGARPTIPEGCPAPSAASGTGAAP
jgi:protein phosphatase